MLLKRISVVGILLLSVACKPNPDKEPVATVNGDAITRKEFNEQVERNMARYRGQSNQLPPGIEQRIQESVLRRMIDDKVIEQKAKALEITVSEEEIGTKFTEHKGRFRTEQAFADYLKRSNNTEANMKDDLRRNLLRDRVVEKLSGPIEVLDDEVQKYYTENLERFKEKEQVRASRILIRVANNGSDADKKAAMKDAKKVQALAAKAGADFAALAKEYSKGPEAGRDGDLGWFSRGRMPPEFDEVAFKLQADKVSGVIETKMGYEIVKVWEKKAERQRPMTEVQENIKNSLLARKRNEKRREVLRTLKSEAKVEQKIKFDQQPAAAPGPRVASPTDGSENTPAPAPAPEAAPAPAQPGQ